MRTALLVALTVALAVPASAAAATAHLEGSPSTSVTAVYDAAPGEQNRLAVSYDDSNATLTLKDSGAEIEAGDGCTAVDSHSVRCKQFTPDGFGPAGGYPVNQLRAALGNRDDRLSAQQRLKVLVTADGGAGDDALEGGSHEDRLDGGPGGDVLVGRGASDTLTDGDSGGGQADRMVGGRNDFDVVSYAGRTRGLRVDLTRGTGGTPGEGDRLQGIETVLGGTGDDRLRASRIGTNPTNVGTRTFGSELHGNAGDDVLTGGPQSDRLYGDGGDDRLRAGARRDSLYPGPGRDALRCGQGRTDVVFRPAPGELLLPACEHMVLGAPEVSFDMPTYPTRMTRKAASFDVECPGSPEPVQPACDGSLELREAAGKRRLLGTAPFSIAAADQEETKVRATVDVPLNALGRRLVDRRRGVATTVAYEATLEDGTSSAEGWTVRLQSRR
jgi:hypothetical protein